MSHSFFKDSELEKFIVHHARLDTGEKLEGRIIDVRNDRKVLIDFGNFRALAETDIPVKPGMTINVVVTARTPKLRLKLEAATSTEKKNTLSDQARKALHSLQQEPVHHRVREQLRLLTGIDGILEVLFPAVEAAAPTSAHVLNVKTNSPGTETGNNPTDNQLALLVDAGPIGQVRLDFQRVPREKTAAEKLNITIYITTGQYRREMETRLAQVRKPLEDIFHSLVLNVIVSERKVLQFNQEELETQTGSRHVLDVNV